LELSSARTIPTHLYVKSLVSKHLFLLAKQRIGELWTERLDGLELVAFQGILVFWTSHYGQLMHGARYLAAS
jgi:hypothetical protein